MGKPKPSSLQKIAGCHGPAQQREAAYSSNDSHHYLQQNVGKFFPRSANTMFSRWVYEPPLFCTKGWSSSKKSQHFFLIVVDFLPRVPSTKSWFNFPWFESSPHKSEKNGVPQIKVRAMDLLWRLDSPDPWRSRGKGLHPLKIEGHFLLNHPKKVTSRIARKWWFIHSMVIIRVVERIQN